LTASFTPQQYPLYAVPLNKVADPARFELTIEPVRLVIGWTTDDDGTVLPLLSSGAPAGTAWTGPVFYEETRERAEQTAKRVEKADRASVREARMTEVFDRWDSWTDRVSQRGEQILDRLGPK
jgi:hypothetical protein